MEIRDPKSAIFFINYQETQSAISLPDSDSNFFSQHKYKIFEFNIFFHLKNVSKISKKSTCFKLDVRTFWSELQSCYSFYILPNCIKNNHT